MPPKDKPPVQSKGVRKPSFPGIGTKHRRSIKLDKKELQGIIELPDIEIEVRRGKLVILGKSDKRIRSVIRTSQGIELVVDPGKQPVDPTSAPRSQPLVPGALPNPVQHPELSGLKQSKIVPRIAQPPGTEPVPPKGKPEKKKRWWRGRA